MFGTVAAHVAPPPGLRPPVAWGEEGYLRTLFGDRIRSLRARTRTCTLRTGSPEDYIAFFRRWFGPVIRAYEALDEAGQEALTADLVSLVRRWNADREAVSLPSSYLEAVAVRA